MKYTQLLILLSAALAPASHAAIPTALPSFKSEKQLTTWRAEQVAKSATASVPEYSDFYTGKPYVHSSKGYAFKYRTYTPVESRWTSEDPSGFPDGANSLVYTPCPTSQIDYEGLYKIFITHGSTDVDYGATTSDNVLRSYVRLQSEGSGLDGGGYDSFSLTGYATATRFFPTASLGNLYVSGAEANGALTADISIQSNGTIKFTETGSGRPDNSVLRAGTTLTVGQGIQYTYSPDGKSVTVKMLGGAGIGVSGINGAGFSVGGAGASVNWDHGTRQQGSMVYVTFKVE